MSIRTYVRGGALYNILDMFSTDLYVLLHAANFPIAISHIDSVYHIWHMKNCNIQLAEFTMHTHTHTACKNIFQMSEMRVCICLFGMVSVYLYISLCVCLCCLNKLWLFNF